ncbi:putative Armadillo repeat-containing protein 8 [Hypsibius exemplaris]|uniref:Armadillo repeat-containing protein 8 n=1 Tax=Hypsibius exemplaris TaxID=2072580 RepID=A0A1W0WQM9_HYPEX|nr:putative Armadillo repeat-containing protein 8 [Hypsibius exemplaris]
MDAMAEELKLTAGYYINLSDESLCGPLMARLQSDREDLFMEGIRILRLCLTCSPQQKMRAFELRIPEILAERLSSPNISSAAVVEILHTYSGLGANFSYGTSHLLFVRLPAILLDLLSVEEVSVTDAALGCLRLFIRTPHRLAQVTDLFKERPDRLLRLIDLMDASPMACEVACEILFFLTDQLEALSESSLPSLILPAVLAALDNPRPVAKRTSLNFLASCCGSEKVLALLIASCASCKDLMAKRLLDLLDPAEDAAVRILALNILVALHKRGFHLFDDRFLSHTILPMLARLCRKEQGVDVRVGAAEILTVLIDDREDLQEIASYCDQLLVSLSAYLRLPSLESIQLLRKGPKGQCSVVMSLPPCRVRLPSPPVKNEEEEKPYWHIFKPQSPHKRRKEEPALIAPASAVVQCGQELKRSAFLLFSALASTNEAIRKRVGLISGVVEAAVTCSTAVDSRLAYAALRLLHSLSRSIQHLRTVFKEHNVWKTAFTLLSLSEFGDPKLAVISSAILSNLSIELSSCHTDLVQISLWTTLVTLLMSSQEEVVINIVWTLMNLSYMANPETKQKIEEALPPSSVGALLKHRNSRVIICTVGLVRNLLHRTPVRDAATLPLPANADVTARILRRMRGHAFPETSAVKKAPEDVMENTYSQELLTLLLTLLADSADVAVLEQCFCALANVAVSARGRLLLLANKESMDLIKRGVLHPDVQVAVPAVTCVRNLALPEEDNGKEEVCYLTGADRIRKLIDLSFMTSLTRLLGTADAQLFARVKEVVHLLNGSPK